MFASQMTAPRILRGALALNPVVLLWRGAWRDRGRQRTFEFTEIALTTRVFGGAEGI